MIATTPITVAVKKVKLQASFAYFGPWLWLAVALASNATTGPPIDNNL
jgi:hypothetical protein